MSRELRVLVALAGSPLAATGDLTWTDVSDDVLAGDGVQLQRGATSPTGSASAGSATFTLDNRSGAHSPAALLRRAVRFVAADGGATYELGRFHVTDAVEFWQGLRRIRVTCSDVLTLAAEANVGGPYDHWLDAAGVGLCWPLDAEGSAPYRGTVALAEVDVDGDGSASATYGDITFGVTGSDCPTQSGASTRFEPADPGLLLGFTGLRALTPPSAAFGLSFWMRATEPWWPSGTAHRIGLSLDNEIAPNVARGRSLGFGYSLPKTGGQRIVCPLILAGGQRWEFSGDSYPAIDIGNGWVHWDFRWDGSTASLVLTHPDGRVDDLTTWAADIRCDGWFTTIPVGGPSYAGAWAKSITLGGVEPWFDPALMAMDTVGAGSVELAEVAFTAGSMSAPSVAVASIGHPGETAAQRLARLAGEAGWDAGALSVGSLTVPMSGKDHDRRALAAHVQAIEDLSLGLAMVDASGAIVVVTREQWESAASVATVAADQLLLDADGASTNTGFLANTATVTRGDGVTVSATSAGSLATFGELADDRSLATDDADYAALAAGWLANNRANPGTSYGLPSLTMQVGEAALLPGGGLFPGPGLLPGAPPPAYVVDCGDVVTVQDVVGPSSSLRVRVTGVSWAMGKEGWRCTWHGRPDSTPDYFLIDTDSIDGPAIIGW